MEGGIHHLHTRKRVYEKLERYPSRSLLKHTLDRLMFFGAFAGPLVLLHQVFNVYAEQNASSLSLATWSLLALGNLLWVAYGLLHRENPIIISHGLTVLFTTAIAVGILLYS